ncbi:MDR family MFS transporter [Phenylobacterium sp.]|uniref:MDR family MFS transporter n=2 Tax=Phenylobacterium sp. TaxID=1871053 RepID=UPI0008D824E0|nr:MDR family MFS transporter [Phenylobacterium sp.]OHB35046.1 MAG: multidrug MFS transporter [Phenylobacterium sp. RIFCSPHIGHO2_01_FULL_70_10]
MQEPHVEEADRRLTLISVLIVFLLSAMSQTVVATAMPRIVADLSGLQLYAWATTSYLLASTVMVPIWGKLGDIFGRKAILLVGIGVFLVGSWLAGLSGEFGDLPLLGGGMTQLIAFRAVQGIGGGALFTTAFAIIADLYAPRERAQFSGLFGAVFGVGSVFGPVIGGFFTDHGTVSFAGHVIEGWRWVFYVNVPFALAAVAMITLKMPELPRRGEGRIDYAGAALIVVGFTALLLAITWGGRDYAWTSGVILGLLALSAATLTAFVFVERAVWDPILPLELFRNRTFNTANGAAFVYSMAFMGVTSFLPLYMQVGQGVPATRSGLTMLALMVGLIASSTINGQLVTRTGRYKPFMIGGGAILIVGVFTLCFIGPDTGTLDLAWRLLLVGIGLGPGQSLFSLAVQNAVPMHQLGVATSSGQFVRQIGSTMGVALFGALLTSGLTAELDRLSAATPGVQVERLELSDLQRMAMERDADPAAAEARLSDPQARAVDHVVRQSFSTAVVHGIVFSLAVLIIGFVLMLMIPVMPLRERAAPPARAGPPEPEAQAAGGG